MPAIATRIEDASESLPQITEDFVAELTQVAYETALRHGIKGSFTDLYLDIWHRLRNVVEERTVSRFIERVAISG